VGTTDGGARIELYRANHVGIDRLSPAELWVDNIPRGSVLPGDTLECAVEAGSHRVQVKAEDATSKETMFALAPNERLRLTVSSRPGMAWFNSLLLGKAVKLRLSRTEPDAP
jgi:hypothetical protein